MKTGGNYPNPTEQYTIENISTDGFIYQEGLRNVMRNYLKATIRFRSG
jgi:hypothetical protein